MVEVPAQATLPPGVAATALGANMMVDNARSAVNAAAHRRRSRYVISFSLLKSCAVPRAVADSGDGVSIMVAATSAKPTPVGSPLFVISAFRVSNLGPSLGLSKEWTENKEVPSDQGK